jgi:hypothetical protein
MRRTVEGAAYRVRALLRLRDVDGALPVGGAAKPQLAVQPA